MNPINYIFEYLVCLTEVCIFYFLLNYLSENKVNYTKPVIGFFIFTTTFFIFIFTLFQFPIYIQGVLTFLIYFIFSSIYDFSFFYKFFILLLFNVVILLIDFFFISVLGSISSIYPEKVLDLRSNLRYIISLFNKLMMFLCVYSIAKILKPNKILLPKRYSFFIWGIFLLTIFTILFLFQQSLVLSVNTKFYNILLVTSITFMIIDAIVFYYYLSSNQFYLQSQKKEIEKLYQKANKKYIKESKQQTEYLYKIWHDLNNHIKNLELLMNNANHKDSFPYMESLKKSVNKIPNKILTGNKIADVVFNQKSTDAALNDIKFYVKANLPSKLTIEDTDFSSILFNTIDNAIEASLNIEKKEDRLIHIEIYPKRQYLYYEIINNIAPSMIQKRKKYFNKKEYLSPGYGLMILQDIADKYDGYLNYGIMDGQFQLRMYLLLDKI
ncbi:Sensor histidine kinase YesM [Garciella nitratireducens DSM 15102]|uniref:Sensor histidine kinase YesM n=2 Tax=Garciella TaxID=218204 RepID=A0A1T4MZC7_9FIRM|nr:Sensor histidine kinase YesM [Garciella nitratireducens DSM 15102]